MHDDGKQRIRILDGRHELTVHALTMTTEAFTVAYSVTPPLPDDLPPVSPAAPPLFLWLEAVDDLGNQYTDYGGAHGLSTDGLRTEGSVSGRPAIAAEADCLTVRMVFLRGVPEQAYEFSLPLSDEG
ncbi:hypothetical protein ACIRYZ_25010 [Kitasatospora sp. NPDC101155]|uniref:hypothetical protein n=1 Tax=Kitasatospora sp. NPDC101155 TaxID=3364097 RepID=UPI0037F4B09B